MRNTTEADCSARAGLFGSSGFDVICTVARRSLTHRFRGMPTDAIQDAVQEAACKLYEKGMLRSDMNQRIVYSWIYTTASRELGHALRRIMRNHTGMTVTPAAVDSRAESGPEVYDAGATPPCEFLHDILTYRALIGNLSRNLAEAMQLHMEGYTADEIAGRVGCSRAAAYKRIQRAYFELKEMWRKEESRMQALLA
jgi:DNA-directed RNA polymerase specialized sigma24 family protein